MVLIPQDRVSKNQIGTGRRVGDLYVLETLHVPIESTPTVMSSFCLDQNSSPFYLWHSRLGHISSERLHLLLKSGLLGNISASDISECSGCKLAKMSALPFNRSSSVSTSPFQLVHTDLWGPSPIATKGGSLYYVSFVDDYSRFTWVYLLTHKSDFYQAYRNFHSMVQTEFSTEIKVLRSDLGGEYSLGEFIEFLASHGTIHQSSCTDTPTQNGRAERKHRHLLNTDRSLLLSSSVPAVFWGEAVLIVAYLLNRMPTPLLSGSTPYAHL
jgi:transposase InsO family protein